MQRIRVAIERRSARHDAGCPDERRTACWSIEQCDLQVRARCHAFITKENCWDFWVLKGARYKACCHRLDDCRDCPIVQRKFPDVFPVYVHVPPVQEAQEAPQHEPPSPMCDQLQFLRGELPKGTALRRWLRDFQDTDRDLFRCRRRGAYLDFSFVGDICTSRRGKDCVFL